MGAAPISDNKKKWVAWSPMGPFALEDKKNSVVVVKCEWALRNMAEVKLCPSNLFAVVVYFS